MREEVGWWLQAARRDRQMAAALSEDGLYEGVAFHAQQGAEKALKSLLLARGLLWGRTHSAVALLDMLRQAGVEVAPELQTQARKLDAHYIDSRYPNGVGGPPEHFYDATIASEALGAMNAIFAFAEANLGPG